jgi:5-methylcytosine-specific restriction endonuclease McrA
VKLGVEEGREFEEFEEELLPFDKRKKPEYPDTEERDYLSAREKIGLVETQGKVCKLCGCKPSKFEFDHVLALSEGGTNELSNWQAVCRDCHVTKSGKEAARRKKRHRLRGDTGPRARREREKKREPFKVNRNGSLSVKR